MGELDPGGPGELDRGAATGELGSAMGELDPGRQLPLLADHWPLLLARPRPAARRTASPLAAFRGCRSDGCEVRRGRRLRRSLRKKGVLARVEEEEKRGSGRPSL